MAAIWITNWIKKTMVFVWQVQHFGMHAALLCGRRWALEVWWLCCVALPCNSHATHTQHTVNTTRNTSTFPVNSQSKCASCAKIWHLHLKTGFWVNPSKSARSLRIYRKSARVACCVDCVLRVCCMWVAWQGHATQPSYFQSPAPATQKSGMRPKVLHLPHKYHRFFYPICNSDCCHDILHPFSYCQPMSWAYEKVVLAETVTMPFVSVREDFSSQHSTTSSLQDEVVEWWYKKSSPGAMARDPNVRSPLQPPLQSCNWKGLNAPRPSEKTAHFWRPTCVQPFSVATLKFGGGYER